jgi:outer membrane protein assembly factor BamB
MRPNQTIWNLPFAMRRLMTKHNRRSCSTLVFLVRFGVILLALGGAGAPDRASAQPPESAAKSAPRSTGNPPWTGWRGANRDARVGWLPEKLSERPNVIWRQPLSSRGVSGIAATRQIVIVPDRDLADLADVFHGYDPATGREIWTVRYPAPGKLDYGNGPRATPLISGDHAFLFGAFGHLTCVEWKTGKRVWQLDVRTEFDVTAKMPWGLCGSPLIVDDKLILAPGGKQASVVALDPATGDILWECPGKPAGYGSLFAAHLGGRLQLVGHDESTLGGWDPATGKRLWSVTPPTENDFNVPTPLVYKNHLIVSTEHNGTRMYRFAQDGQADPQPVATHAELNPDTQSPVIIGSRLFGAVGRLYCLDLDQGLKTLWTGDDKSLLGHVSLIAGEKHLLIGTESGELLLVDGQADRFQVISRLSPWADETGLLSHPTLVDRVLYLRGSNEIICLSLEP